MRKAQIVQRSLLLAGVFLVVFASAELSTTASPVAAASPATSANEYIDSHACASCHSAIYEKYTRTSMGRSFFQPAPANTIEDYTGKHEYYQTLSDTHYAMIARDGGYFQRRWQVGPDGAESNVEEMKVDYVVGAGDQARTYLHRTARNTLIELPLGWYSERGGYWAMNPGFDSRHPQTRRLISYECMFCHNGYPGQGTSAGGVEPVFGAQLPEGVDCQRCHGPGGEHIRVARDRSAKMEDVATAIVNPARLEPKRQMEVCMQCHLEPTSTRLPSILRKFDRTPFDYVAGQPLEDFNRYFDFAAGKGKDDRFELVSAAYRLRKSRCFLESKESLTCLSCHDPHESLPTGEAAVQVYAKACLRCHEPAVKALAASGKYTASPDCTSCHMPKRRTDDVVHAVVTDHLIQRVPPKGDLLAERAESHPTPAEEYHGEVVAYYPLAPANTAENRLYHGVAQVGLQNNTKKGIAELQRELSLNPSRQAEFYSELGKAQQENGSPKEAVATFEHASLMEPESASVLESLAEALRLAGDTARSQEMLTRALRAAPLDPRAWYQAGILEAQLGRMDSALEKLRKALALDPDIPEGYFSLANLLARMGQLEAADAALQSALEIDPYDAAAYDLAGQMLSRKGNSSEALYRFEKAVRLRPGYPPYLYDYALGLLHAQRFEEAKTQVQAAIQANPSFAEAHEVLGSLYARARQLPQARGEYEKVVELQPEVGRAQLNLGLILVAQGDQAGASAHLRKAAAGADVEIARQATVALQQMHRP